MMDQRWAIHVDGIKLPGYRSYEEAQAAINADPDLKSRGAVPVQLLGAINTKHQDKQRKARKEGSLR